MRTNRPQICPPVLLLAALLCLGPAPLCADGVLYVSSFGNGQVFRYDSDSGALTDTFVTSSSNSEPHGVLDRGVDVLVTHANEDRVARYDRNTGEFLGDLITSAGGIDYPVYMAIGPDGLLYLSSQGNDSIRSFNPITGDPVATLVPSGSGGLDGPSGFAFLDGTLYVAGRYSGDVLAYDAVTGAFQETVLGAADGLAGGSTFGLQIGDNGDMYVASNGAIRRCDLTTGVLTPVGLGFPIGVENHPDGGVVVATGGNLRIVSTADNSLSSPLLGPGASISTLNFFHYSTFAGLPGDFNGDGAVDSVDYAVWREALGTNASLAGNGYEFGPSSGLVDEMDFWLWQNSYGASIGDGGASVAPEPAVMAVLACGLVVLSSGRHRRP